MASTIVTLAADVGRLFRKRFEAGSQVSSVTGPQLRLLRAIERRPGASQIALATLLDVEPITAGRMIDRLTRTGMVERRPDPSDRRAWRLHLTDTALPHVREARLRSDALTERALAGFSSGEREQLACLLERMRDNLCAADPVALPKVVEHG
jgi:MarR family transcriptional regulator for hemolysin